MFFKKYWYQNELEFLPKRNKKIPVQRGFFHLIYILNFTR
jgi:hypothetical protein